MSRFLPVFCFLWVLAVVPCLPGQASSQSMELQSCEQVADQVNRQLDPSIDSGELAALIRFLGQNRNERLPAKFITKEDARRRGWRPGMDLWAVTALRGKSIGGDAFGNREGRLPKGGRVWREADLDYKGGKRGPKRLVYANDGLRMVTVDHYATFREVPACR